MTDSTDTGAPNPGAPNPGGPQAVRRAFPRRIGVLLAAVPVIAVGLADATIAVRTAHPSDRPKPAAIATATPSAQPSSDPQFTLNDAETKRNAALRELLDRRRRAVLSHDEQAFLATDDPAQPRFRAAQRREFEALSAVPLASWDYDINLGLALPPSTAAQRYGVPTFAPVTFDIKYAIKDFDAKPVTLTQTPTFVQRPAGWFVASFNDYASVGNPSALGIWDFGPLRTVRVGNVLAIGHPQSMGLMRNLANVTAAAIPNVSAVWGRDWPRKVVLLVPATQRELSQIVDDSDDLSQIVALASAEVASCPLSPSPVGDRIAINPRNWPTLSSLGRRIVLTHELTHVASRADTNSCMPTWLIEGFADYVAYKQSSLPVHVIATELGADVRAGRAPSYLPPNRDFAGSSKRLAQAYEGGFLACRL
ncbi:MAG: hypothetical protein JO079_01935, partial [Frankiaceae bacterium]|nr:hypothetical protein [Frankiaceae bacterium]MBV9369459.1 hypothetical protein [Frankiales bacterium]